MNAEQLLAHFERISEAPDAISRLRRFVLDLAVRGKLVDQDPEDESAEELLICIAKHNKASLSTASDKSSLPFELPTGWTHTTFRTLVESSGSGWSPKTLDTPREGNEWGILKVSAVSWDKFRPEANKQVLPGTQPRPQAVVRKGDFLISRANTAELVARAVIVDLEPVNLMMSDKIVRLELVELCEPKYVLINNNYSSFSRSYYADRATGVSPSMKNVTRDVILDLPIPLPPLAEQHRIVAKVDELMALCDQLESARQERQQGRERLMTATLQRLNQPAEDPSSFRQDASFALQVLPSLTTTPAQIKQLRQTILNLAVRGKLVEQDPEDEPAEELLILLATEKQTQRNGRNWEANASVAADPLFDMPRGWHLTVVAATARRVTVGYVGPMKDQYVADGIPFLRSQNVRANRFREDGLVYISRDFHAKISKSSISPGDVVVVRSGNVGTACAIPASISEGNCSDLVIIQEPICVCPEYLCFYLNSMAQVHVASGTVGVALTHFNTKSVANMPIPLPPLAEQHRIVAKVDELMGLCDQLEQQLNQADQQRRRLLEAVLAEALVEPEKTLEAAYA
jgi:type I restriction enzyme S subunit